MLPNCCGTTTLYPNGGALDMVLQPKGYGFKSSPDCNAFMPYSHCKWIFELATKMGSYCNLFESKAICQLLANLLAFSLTSHRQQIPFAYKSLGMYLVSIYSRSAPLSQCFLLSTTQFYLIAVQACIAVVFNAM